MIFSPERILSRAPLCDSSVALRLVLYVFVLNLSRAMRLRPAQASDATHLLAQGCVRNRTALSRELLIGKCVITRTGRINARLFASRIFYSHNFLMCASCSAGVMLLPSLISSCRIAFALFKHNCGASQRVELFAKRGSGLFTCTPGLHTD